MIEESIEKIHERVKRIDLPITGMSCAACVKGVENALTSLDGVISVSVNIAGYSSVDDKNILLGNESFMKDESVIVETLRCACACTG
ncbi:MAG: cation transporter [Nitrospirae bacterium]|nr:cation transporter [Nitrospirota bacterium]